MSCIMIDKTQSAPFADGDTYIYVRAVLICDTVADLPAQDFFTNYFLTQGTTAHVISDTTDYEMQSDGTWVLKQGTDLQSLVNQISTLSDDVQNAYSDIDSLTNRVSGLENATALLIDNGAKNKIPIPANTQTLSGITYTPDNAGRIATTGTASGNSFYIASNLDLISGEELMLTGCPSGGSYSSGFALYIAKNVSGASTLAYDEGDGVTFTVPETANYNIRIIVRNGTDMNGKTFSPMLTYPEYMQYSTAFVPYSPSNAELYRIIKQYHP